MTRSIVLGILTCLLIAGCGPSRPATVKVSGTITTRGFRTHPTSVTFSEVESQSVTTVATPGDGAFSVELANGKSYNVTVSWQGLLGVRGTCSAGVVSVNSETPTFPYSGAC